MSDGWDWRCSRCGAIVFGSRDYSPLTCFYCDSNRPAFVQATSAFAKSFVAEAESVAKSLQYNGSALSSIWLPWTTKKTSKRPPKQEPQQRNLQQKGKSRPQDNDDEKLDSHEAGECVVCFERPQQVALTSCGHLAMCDICAKQVNDCPICRKSFLPSQILPIFRA
jgi:hypothetical protein